MLSPFAILFLTFLLSPSEGYVLRQRNNVDERFSRNLHTVDNEDNVWKTIGTMGREKHINGRDLGGVNIDALMTLLDIHLNEFAAFKSMKLTFLKMLTTNLQALTEQIEKTEITDFLDSPIFTFIAQTVLPLLSGTGGTGGEQGTSNGDGSFPDLIEMEFGRKNETDMPIVEDVIENLIPGKNTADKDDSQTNFIDKDSIILSGNTEKPVIEDLVEKLNSVENSGNENNVQINLIDKDSIVFDEKMESPISVQNTGDKDNSQTNSIHKDSTLLNEKTKKLILEEKTQKVNSVQSTEDKNNFQTNLIKKDSTFSNEEAEELIFKDVTQNVNSVKNTKDEKNGQLDLIDKDSNFLNNKTEKPIVEDVKEKINSVQKVEEDTSSRNPIKENSVPSIERIEASSNVKDNAEEIIFIDIDPLKEESRQSTFSTKSSVRKVLE